MFEKHSIRRLFDEDEESGYFSVVDVILALTDSVNPRDYWFKMKSRVKSEDGLELSTICRQLKLPSADGKKYAAGMNENAKAGKKSASRAGAENRQKCGYWREFYGSFNNPETIEGEETMRQVLFPIFATEDMPEGMKAFIEKRKPEWKGK